MKSVRSGWFLAAGILFLAAATGAASAEQGCAVFALSPRAANREYRSCEACLNDYDRCEERCAGYICTAVGYDRRDNEQMVQGDFDRGQKNARRSAVARCKEQGLIDCNIDRCTEEQDNDAQLCPNHLDSNHGRPQGRFNRPERFDDRSEQPEGFNDRSERSRRHDRPEPPRQPDRPQVHPAVVPPRPQVRPARPQPPAQKYVVSWQHIKEKCIGKPYSKIAQQCGNRVGYWHGIRCRVTWSDGNVTDLVGKVDQVDAYGRKYCTRATRPANFNCVNRCDDTNGPLTSLPRP